MMAMLLAVTLGAIYVGSVVIARHRAQSAADLAALAAATAMPAGSGLACDKASAVARAMGTAMAACAVEDLDVTVTVDVPVRLPWGIVAARAAARAGPVE
jgi:secretion/DNA translocation related TadE-like protein